MLDPLMTSAAGTRAIGYLADPRPAWLWSGDGKKLLWHNVAATLVGAKAKKHKIKRQPKMVPIKGQIARLIRLGAVGHSSLSRMQFLRGSKPVSTTCTCTPLMRENDKLCLLVVGVDPINAQVMERVGLTGSDIGAIFGADIGFALTDADGALIVADDAHEEGTHTDWARTQLPAGPNGEMVTLFSRPDAEQAETVAPADVEPKANTGEALADPASSTLASTTPNADPSVTETENAIEGGFNNLTELLDKLSEDEKIFAPLDNQSNDAPTQDDAPEADTPADVSKDAATPKEPETVSEQSPEVDATADAQATPPEDGDAADDDVADAASDQSIPDAKRAYWQIVGRGFEPKKAPSTAPTPDPTSAPTPDPSPAPTASPASDPTPADVAQEQSTRYNFAELSRILNERIAGERAEARAPKKAAAVEPPTNDTEPSSGALFNLSDESLVLNRLPLGLLIFKDQKILFANRAMTDLVGYEDSVTLRAQGLDAIFPRQENDGAGIGPVTQLAHRSGGSVPVAARLQAINWQGNSALMLTAKAQTSEPSVEGAVRGFAEQLASIEDNGYFETSRAGIISSVSGQAADMFGRTPEVLIGRPLLLMVDHSESAPLRRFLEQAARKAETARPAISLKGLHPDLRVILFAEGQAGYVSGYFGIVQRVSAEEAAAVPSGAADKATGLDPEILAQLSRGMRRPLNTIIGFSELVRSNAFGPIENPRYMEYARDIKIAGQEIVRSVDEIEELARIDSGSYDAEPADCDLTSLLHTCVGKIRTQAGRARVFVRSSIPDDLPNIHADAPSLAQAILNLLASAINQAGAGGHVVFSAQQEDDGSVEIHVRGTGITTDRVEEQFVVFREDAPLAATGASSVGLALTRSLLAINTCTLSIESSGTQGHLLSLFIPAELTAPLT